jgi:hypothetical protein
MTGKQKTLAMVLLVLLQGCTAKKVASVSEDPEVAKRVEKIRKEIEEIRGAKFKSPVRVSNQSLQDFSGYVEQQLGKQFSDELNQNYGKVVRMLGLYRGPEIEDFKAMAKGLMQSQAAAYYDPEKHTFFVVMQNLPEMTMNTIYAHELYHGFQDQHYDLDGFFLSQVDALNDDELLARQAVVEGEATYLMSLWSLKTLMGSIPEGQMLDMTISMQSNMDAATLATMMKSGMIDKEKMGDMEKALEAMDDVPPFMIELMLGSYMKGQGFVHQIRKQGWEKVAELYATPPVSSEQILHPEKWISNERPEKIDWPPFERDDFFDNWTLLEGNTLGEIQLRQIFTEHELTEAGKDAAAGWNGDRYAVLKRKDSDDLLLLLQSAWDTDQDAEEFAAAYRKLLEVKYQDMPAVAVTVELNGKSVLIVEGATPGEHRALINFISGR